MGKAKSLGKKVMTYLWQAFVISMITLLLFEASFRSYFIDFYQASFEYLNLGFEKKNKSKSLMIVGDSFSAFKQGYAQTLRDSLQEYKVSNISVPGTSIREQYLFGRHHIKKEEPDILIFQFYIGNDLFSWNHPAKMDVSLQRKIYWKLSEHLWSLNFINYSLAGLKPVDKARSGAADLMSQEFDPQQYTQRQKIYFSAEPGLIENASELRNGRKDDLDSYLQRMQELFEFAGKNCEIYVLVIPHCAQLNDIYLQRMGQLGARFSRDFETGLTDYPLYEEMRNFFSNDERVEVLNPISGLRLAEKNGQSVYFNNDSHFNLAGQQVIGNYLLKELRK